MAFNTAFSPMGDHLLRPPIVWPAVKSNEMIAAIRRSTVAVILICTIVPLDPPSAFWPARHRPGENPRPADGLYCNVSTTATSGPLLLANAPASFLEFDDSLRRDLGG